MATSQAIADFILDQLGAIPDAKVRRMFGEYALYACSGKVVAFICDDRLFMKPVAGNEAFAKECQPAPAYPGSKDYLMVPEEKVEEREWLADFVRVTAEALPKPKPKQPKKRP